jgi:hypothetical protein
MAQGHISLSNMTPTSKKIVETIISPLAKELDEGDVDKIVPHNVDVNIKKEAKVDTNVEGPTISKKIHQQSPLTMSRNRQNQCHAICINCGEL